MHSRLKIWNFAVIARVWNFFCRLSLSSPLWFDSFPDKKNNFFYFFSNMLLIALGIGSAFAAVVTSVILVAAKKMNMTYYMNWLLMHARYNVMATQEIVIDKFQAKCNKTGEKEINFFSYFSSSFFCSWRSYDVVFVGKLWGFFSLFYFVTCKWEVFLALLPVFYWWEFVHRRIISGLWNEGLELLNGWKMRLFENATLECWKKTFSLM